MKGREKRMKSRFGDPNDIDKIIKQLNDKELIKRLNKKQLTSSSPSPTVLKDMNRISITCLSRLSLQVQPPKTRNASISNVRVSDGIQYVTPCP
jgi:hypothetical protein